jgi:hypothetical protein
VAVHTEDELTKSPETRPQVNKPTTRDPNGSTVFIAGVCLLVFIFLFDLVSIGRQPSWQDEIYVVSTGWSIARSQPPILSVMAQYPHSDSPVQFYGPVSFEANAQLTRLFGLSIVAWRLACFTGLILTLLLSAALVRLAGGDKWAQLLAALIIGITEPLVVSLPGRWDAVTSALYLCGLLLLLRSVQVTGRSLLWRAALAGLFLGFALGSTPRALTLTLALLVAAFLTALFFRTVRRRLLLSTAVMFTAAISVQNLLLLPWGLNSLSWYDYVRQATKGDAINATLVAGQGALDLHLSFHKTVVFILLLLLLIGILGAATQRRFNRGDSRLALRVFLALCAAFNLSLMLVLLAQALGQSIYWLPPVAIAATSWFDWATFKRNGLRPVLGALAGACIVVLLFQQARQIISVVLTWNRRDYRHLTALVQRTAAPGAIVYGPVSGYFYPVEMAGNKYLYLSEQARAGRYSEPNASISNKLEEEICAHPTYAMWPRPDPVHHPEEEPMPQVLRERLLPKVGEFDQPPLSPWKEGLLDNLGLVGGKYGFPDAAIYPLRSLDNCGQN